MTFLAETVQDKAGEIVLLCSVLIAAFGLVGLAAWYFRRQWKKETGTPETPFTLEDLRQMRDCGALTEGEYQIMRSKMIEVYRGENTSSSATDTETNR